MARLSIWGSMTYSIIQLSVKSKKKRKRSRSSSSSATSESATSSGSDSSGNFSSYYYLVIANWIFGESVRNADYRLGTKYRLKNNTIDHISCWNVPIVMHLFLPVHRHVFFFWSCTQNIHFCVILLLNNQMVSHVILVMLFIDSLLSVMILSSVASYDIILPWVEYIKLWLIKAIGTLKTG